MYKRQPQRQAADDDGGGAGQGGARQLARRLIAVRGVVFGDHADQDTGAKSRKDRKIKAYVLGPEPELDQRESDDRNQPGTDPDPAAQGAQEVFLAGALLGRDEERADDRSENPDRGHLHRDRCV